MKTFLKISSTTKMLVIASFRFGIFKINSNKLLNWTPKTKLKSRIQFTRKYQICLNGMWVTLIIMGIKIKKIQCHSNKHMGQIIMGIGKH